MRSSAHIKGHPLHPMLIPFPFAYLFGSAMLDLWARAARRPRWHRTARDMSTLGLGSALAAAAPGIVDYLFAVPPKSSARQRATQHAMANVSALGLFALARLGRKDGGRPTAWQVAAELAGAGCLAAGGWLGGTLVYRNQIAVDHRYADAGRWRVERIPAGQIGDSGLDVGSTSDLQPDQMKLVRVGDRRLVVARTEDGYVAFDDRCTHKGGPLSDGALACGVVQCPWHGSQFDVRSGTARHGPATDPIATYEVTERDGRLWIAAAQLDRPRPYLTKSGKSEAGSLKDGTKSEVRS
jgi:nitrite reductase/ring-hydroxylating ferredoxin subunit/uncharacterized membrane protein